MKISTKQEMYALYERGMFGNKLRTWKNFSNAMHWLKDEDRVCVRYAKPSSKWTLFNIPMIDAIRAIGKAVVEEGAEVGLFSMNEVGQDDKIVLQGEVMRSPAGIHLTYSQQPGIMHRHAMKDAEHTSGLKAFLLLRSNLSPSSYEDLFELLDLYETSIVEFTAYSVDVGVCRGRNAVIWEVRNY